jgi:hypothetical protein
MGVDALHPYYNNIGNKLKSIKIDPAAKIFFRMLTPLTELFVCVIFVGTRFG